MNTRGSHIILYSIIALLIVGGALLAIFRRPLLDSLQLPITLPDPASFSAAADATMDKEIFQSPRLARLVPQVKIFDFDNICSRPAVVRPGAGETGLATSSSVSLNCRQGNNLPFFKKAD